MLKPKVIAMDCDGTMVSDDKVLTPMMRQALIDLHNEGVLLIMASGRPADMCLKSIEDWQLGFEFDGVIGYNGAELYDNETKKTDEYYKLSKENLKEIVTLLSRFDKGNPFVLDENFKCLNSKYDDALEWAIRKGSTEQLVVKDISELWAREQPKIHCRFAVPEDLDEVISQIHLPEDCPYYCFRTQTTMLEFTDKRTNKGFALKEYCRRHNIDLSEAMACGDTTNDNGMIEVAGMGVCLLNGSDDTKEKANYITEEDVDNNGLAKFFYKYVI